MFGPVKNIVFDFDGTLVDTMSRVVAGLSGAIQHVSGKNVSRDELVATFGPAPKAVLEQWVPEDKVDQALEFWLEFEENSQSLHMKPFDGVDEMLRFLKAENYSLAIFTGRDRNSTLKILRAHSWLGEFFEEADLICGDDGFDPKPSGEGLNHLISQRSWSPAETLMVGDHPHDMRAGRDALTKTAAALWDLGMAGGKTQRARFRQVWEKWGDDICDLRLPAPASLVAWLKIPNE
jgi:pyrophosphatase PpaX